MPGSRSPRSDADGGPTLPEWQYVVDDRAEPVSAEQLDAAVAALLLAMVEADQSTAAAAKPPE